MKEQQITELPKEITAPVLIIAFNRPDTLQKVFDRVRQVRPPRFYLAVDAPRPGREDDVVNCLKVQEIVNQVDWPCEVNTLFQKVNKGCGRGPAEAISWAFTNEDSMIILEDDCVPALSFFSFCEEMLNRYCNDTRIGIISGRSHQHGCEFFEDSDYLFTHFAHTCGWATWKDRWLKNDFLMSDCLDFILMGGAENIMPNKQQAIYLNKRLERVYNDIDNISQHAWDYQWSFTRLKNGWLDIVPCCNLIQNIGVGESATHSKVATSSLTMPYEEMPMNIRHPKFVMINRGYEERHFNKHIHKKTPFYRSVSQFIRNLFNHRKS